MVVTGRYQVKAIMKWAKGQSGNLRGRPKGDHGDIRALARTHTSDAIEVLVTIMMDPKAAPSARTSAASALLDRAWGRPELSISASVGESYADVLLRINQEADAEKAEKALPAPSDA